MAALLSIQCYLEPIRSGGDELPAGLKSEVLSIFSTLPDIFTFYREYVAIAYHHWGVRYTVLVN